MTFVQLEMALWSFPDLKTWQRLLLAPLYIPLLIYLFVRGEHLVVVSENKTLYKQLPFEWYLVLMYGWIIEPTACADGCAYAWLRPRLGSAYEMVGCVGHTVLPNTHEELSVSQGRIVRSWMS